MNKKSKLVKCLRPCSGVDVAVWMHQSESGNNYYTTSVRKSWPEADGKYQERKVNLNPEELAAVAIAATRLVAWMADNHPSQQEAA